MEGAAHIADYGSPSKASARAQMSPLMLDKGGEEKALFLGQLLNKLEKFEELTFDERLAVTGLFATLAKLPQEGLHEQLFHAEEGETSERSLNSVLDKLWTRMMDRKESMGKGKISFSHRRC